MAKDNLPTGQRPEGEDAPALPQAKKPKWLQEVEMDAVFNHKTRLEDTERKKRYEAEKRELLGDKENPARRAEA